MDYAILSMAAGSPKYQQDNEPCLRTHEQFCSTHSVPYHLTTDIEPYVAEHGRRPYPWYKLLAIRDALKIHEFVLWIDCDAMFALPQKDHVTALLEGFERTGKALIFAVDDAGNINSGVMAFRRTPDTSKMIGAMWKQEQFIDHGWWENMALIHMFETAWFRQLCHVVPQESCCIMQGYPGHAGERNGSLVVHFAGGLKGSMAKYTPRHADFEGILEKIKAHFDPRAPK